MTPKAARALIAGGQADQALAISHAAIEGPAAADWLPVHAEALKALGRPHDALPFLERAAELAPGSMARRHNLASLLGDLGQAEAAEVQARAALELGGDAPETWLVLARAVQAQNRFDEAETAYGEALRRRPDYMDALRELAQLRWMLSGDLDAALGVLRSLPAQSPSRRAVEAAVREAAGDLKGAFAACVAGPLDIALALQAISLGVQVDPRAALELAEAVVAQSPTPAALTALTSARLATGDATAALASIDQALAILPDDQHALALQATAWRLLGDPRYEHAYDYARLVGVQFLDTPHGWTSLEAYLADLAASLNAIHGFRSHPFHQSVRGGSQTSVPLETHSALAVRAFFQAIDGPIRRYVAALSQGSDPLRRRNTGRHRLAGAWSVRLGAGGGHVDHIHQRGWISSACYIDLPPAVSGSDRQGWLRFGQAPVGGDLPAQHWVQPRPGLLALFPSYMWHGVQPFDAGSRLTIAFDVVPA